MIASENTQAFLRRADCIMDTFSGNQISSWSEKKMCSPRADAIARSKFFTYPRRLELRTIFIRGSFLCLAISTVRSVDASSEMMTSSDSESCARMLSSCAPI